MATESAEIESGEEPSNIEINREKEIVINTLKHILADRQAVIGLTIIISFLLLAVFAPFLAPYDPDHIFYDENNEVKIEQSPSLEHPMGTDAWGKDVLSQWVYASRITVMVGLLSGFIVGVIGTTVGLIAGYYKGLVDLVIMRVVDVLYGIPATPLILVLAILFANSIWTILIGMALILWRTMARVIRAQTLSLSERPFVKSAKASGASDLRIIYLHIAPNLLPLILIETTFVVANAIILEAGVSFLGIGAELSWGTMLQLTMVTGAIRHAWWWVLPPGLAIMMIVVSFFTVSRAIENITNPEGGGFR